MRDILIAIQSKYVGRILSGEKQVEFRKIAPKENARFFIYESRANKEVVGYFVSNLISVSSYPDFAWDIIVPSARGISKEEYDEYSKGAKDMSTIHFHHSEVVEFKNPVRVKDTYPDFYPPQNWYYLQDGCGDWLIQEGGLSDGT